MKLSSLAGHCLELLEEIDRSSLPPDSVTSRFVSSRSYLGSRDRRYISGIIFGVMRQRRFVEAILEQFIQDHPDADVLNDPHSRYLPVYTIYVSVVERQPTDELMESIRSRWMTYFPSVDVKAFYDAVQNLADLSFLPPDRVVQLGVKHSFQDWMVELLLPQFGESTEELLKALNKPADVVLRVNLRKVTREDCRERLRQEGIETENTRFSPTGLVAKKRFNKNASAAFLDGWYEIQDEGSQLISLLASPRPGSVVLDSCAGAGGKTLHLADLMKENGIVTGSDIDEKRLSELRARVDRAGTSIVSVCSSEELRSSFAKGSADLVLVDAPCSGTGTIRRNPGLKWSVSYDEITRFSALQLALLETHAGFVKLGGELLYVTCSLFREENEAVVEAFLEDHDDFALHSLRDRALELGIEDPGPSLLLTPADHGTDGFFIAAMKRTEKNGIAEAPSRPD